MKSNFNGDVLEDSLEYNTNSKRQDNYFLNVMQVLAIYGKKKTLNSLYWYCVIGYSFMTISTLHLKAVRISQNKFGKTSLNWGFVNLRLIVFIVF